MLSWEYPPRSIGGLARHVEDLSLAIAETNNDIHVVTVGAEDTPEYEIVSGVHVHRFEPYPVNAPDFLTWVLQLNVKMQRRQRELSVMKDTLISFMPMTGWRPLQEQQLNIHTRYR